MIIRGIKTKIGCAMIAVASALWIWYPAAGGSLFMLGVALAFYGLYDRGIVSAWGHAAKIDELKSRIKKPMLRGGI